MELLWANFLFGKPGDTLVFQSGTPCLELSSFHLQFTAGDVSTHYTNLKSLHLLIITLRKNNVGSGNCLWMVLWSWAFMCIFRFSSISFFFFLSRQKFSTIIWTIHTFKLVIKKKVFQQYKCYCTLLHIFNHFCTPHKSNHYTILNFGWG